jgi:molybdate transport system ATP-binding protein
MSELKARVQLQRSGRDGSRFKLDVDLQFDATISAISGRSGAGKSSLLAAILGILRPQEGRIELDREALFDSAERIDRPLYRRRLGVLFQRGALFPHMTVRDNVRFAADGEPAVAERWLEQVGAGGWGERRPHELSGGQTQRVALARALAANPAALLLDEPFSALDREARTELNQLLIELQRERPLPMLYVTHDPADALQTATRWITLHDGRCIGDGEPTEQLNAATGGVGDNLFKATVACHHKSEGYTELEAAGCRWFAPFVDLAPGQPVVYALRAEDPLVATQSPGPTSARNVIDGRIERLESGVGAGSIELHVALGDSPQAQRLRVKLTAAAVDELQLAVGGRVTLLVKASALQRVG